MTALTEIIDSTKRRGGAHPSNLPKKARKDFQGDFNRKSNFALTSKFPLTKLSRSLSGFAFRLSHEATSVEFLESKFFTALIMKAPVPGDTP
jgi:hypothetical protein